MLITITVITIITNSHEASIHGFWRKKKYKKQFINSKLHKKVRRKYLRKKISMMPLPAQPKVLIYIQNELWQERVFVSLEECVQNIKKDVDLEEALLMQNNA